MGVAISVRLDAEPGQALCTLEAAGLSRSEAIREALVHSANRPRRRSELAAVGAREDDREEMTAVARPSSPPMADRGGAAVEQLNGERHRSAPPRRHESGRGLWRP